MNQLNAPASHDSRRIEVRIADLPLEVELRKSRPFNLGKFHLCTFIDINLGGIGIFSDSLVFRVLDRVDVQVHHNYRNYFVRGIVGYRQEISGGNQYGIIFVDVPGELDLLVRKAMHSESSADDMPQHATMDSGTTLVPGGQRRMDVRRTTPVVSIKARRSGTLSSSRYYAASMVDISRQGIGFVSDSFQCELMGEVELVLGYRGHSYASQGIVCFSGKTEEGYRYGVEFTQVEPRLLTLLKPK